MAENTPNSPGGNVPPKPADAAKVQPKKETVRINLPPKPTAAPTIKIPAPSAAGAAAPAAAGAAAPAAAAAKAPAAAAPAAKAVAAPTAAPAPKAAPAPRAPWRPAMRGARTSVVDVVLASGAFLLGLAVVMYLSFIVYM